MCPVGADTDIGGMAAIFLAAGARVFAIILTGGRS
jgi:hypothetical protein